jgi:dTMP kinase
LISFEGGEGTGKSTQIDYFSKFLKKRGFDCVRTREPGGTLGAECIRDILLNLGHSYSPIIETLLFTAARIDHMDELILPALKAGKIVLCDRFIDSTRVYQGIAGLLSQEFLLFLEKVAIGYRVPDLTFIFDLSVDLGLARVSARKNRKNSDPFERANLFIQERRRKAFLRIAEEEPERCCVIDGSKSEKLIAAEIIKLFFMKIHV